MPESQSSNPPPGSIPLDTTFLRGANEGPAGHIERLAADREMMGQILTFCAFIGGIALAALVELRFAASEKLPTLDVAALPVLQVLLAATAAVALLGAFYAMLGIVNHHRMLDRQARLDRMPKDAADRQWWQRDLFGKYANIAVFRQMARLFASVSMATGLVVVIFLAWLIDPLVGAALTFGSVALLVVPAVAAANARGKLIKAYEAALNPPPATPATPSATTPDSGNGKEAGA